jgi:mevalonate kinase
MTVGTACSKLILFGEHAVVYGRPALAVPLLQLRARAEVLPSYKPGILLRAPDLDRVITSADTPDDPLVRITRLTLEALGTAGDFEITLTSDLPVASGMGSGAAISTAIVRGLAAFLGKTLAPAEISALVYETEKLYHGTPSGVDNTVIAYEQPVRFVRRQTAGPEITPFVIAQPFTLAVANTGIASPTRITVGDVRRGWERDPAHYEAIFDGIGVLVERAQDALARGENEQLGELMTRNQRHLEMLGVSSREIEFLVAAGVRAGAGGGKLSGGGRGGNVIFYVEPDRAKTIQRALLDAGAVNVILTTVGA